MKRNLLLSLSVLPCFTVFVNAQDLAKNYKADNNNNPISASVFCADPTALDYNGRLYVYGSNDHQQFIKNNKKDGNGYGDIKSLVVLSTDDMVNWTFHGTIDVQKICSKWTALDGKPARIPAPYHFEASELNIMNGKFVYTYCSSWAERKDAEWNAYKQETCRLP